jgi:hypothetical protein
MFAANSKKAPLPAWTPLLYGVSAVITGGGPLWQDGASRQLWPFLEAQLEAEANRSQAVRVANETTLEGETV